MKRIYVSLAIVLVIFLGSCVDQTIEQFIYTEQEYNELSKTLDLPENYYDYSVAVPSHLFNGSTIHRINSGQNHTATLGRVLFYDTRLSTTNTISCASCHQQELAFSDDKPFSEGVGDMITERNSLALGAAPNLSASYESEVSVAAFGWDHGHQNSRIQSKAAITNLREMGNRSVDDVARKLQDFPEYQILFRKAFGHEHITEFEILTALDAFMNSISAFESKFDAGLKSVATDPVRPFANFSDDENAGKSLFLTHCSSCHGANHDIQVQQIANNGLDIIYKDKGAGNIQGQHFDGLFKVPFLRNIALTAPYMHDGRFETLEDVIDHYSSGIQRHRNLSSQLKEGNKPVNLNFSQIQKNQLVAYLETLTDETMLHSEKHSNPFK